MTTLDEKTLEIYDKINTAIRNGDLLGYASTIARIILGQESMRIEPQSIPETIRSSNRLLDSQSISVTRNIDVVRISNL